MPQKPLPVAPNPPSTSSPSSPKPKKKHKKNPPASTNPNPSSSPAPPRPKPPPSPAPAMSKEAAAESSRKRPHGPVDEEDLLTILNAIVDFRASHGGSTPKPTTMAPVLDAVKDRLRQKIATVDQLYNKFRYLRRRYEKANKSGVGSSPYEREFFDLSVRAWGDWKPTGGDQEVKKKSGGGGGSKKQKAEENGEGRPAADDRGGAVSDDEADEEHDDDDAQVHGDASDSCKVLLEQVKKYSVKEGVPMGTLELGLKFMEKSKAAALERKWRQHLEAKWRIDSKSLEVMKDFLNAISPA